MPLDINEKYCIAAIAFNATVLILYHYKLDPDKRIERFYFKNSKAEHAIFKLCYYILIVSLMMCARHLIESVIKRLKHAL